MIDPEKDNVPNLEDITLSIGDPQALQLRADAEAKQRTDVKNLQKKMQDLYYDFAGKDFSPVNQLVREISDYRTEELEKYLLTYFGDVETATAIGHFFVLEIEDEDYVPIQQECGYENDIVFRFEMKYRLRRLRQEELNELGIKGSLFDAMLELEKKRAAH